MKRLALILGLLILNIYSAGCGGRSGMMASSGDGGMGPSPDSSVKPDSKAPPARCTSLKLAGQATLEFNDDMKMNPRVVWDGARFATVWHTQLGITSSMNGDLRLARVDSAGKADNNDGVPLGADNGLMPPALYGSPGELALVHLPVAKTPMVERRLMDLSGKTVQSTNLPVQPMHSAIASHPTGHALMFAGNSGSPALGSIDRKGKVSPMTSLITAQVMASIWLSSRPGGYAAILHSTNSNGTLYLLDGNLKQQSMSGIGNGALVRSVDMAVRPGGFTSLYVTSAGEVKAEGYDGTGKRGANVSLAKTWNTKLAPGSTSLVWTGEQLVATYSGPAQGQHRLRLLSGEGKAEGKEINLPNCLAVSRSQVSSAWGDGRLAVATVGSASGVANSAVCVTIMECVK